MQLIESLFFKRKWYSGESKQYTLRVARGHIELPSHAVFNKNTPDELFRRWLVLPLSHVRANGECGLLER